MPTVSVVRDNHSCEDHEVENGEVLFDALDDQGCTLPHGCLAGSCGSCRILILEGAQNLSPPSAIEQNTIDHICKTYREKYGDQFLEGKTIRLSCRAKVLGDLKIATIK